MINKNREENSISCYIQRHWLKWNMLQGVHNRRNVVQKWSFQGSNETRADDRNREELFFFFFLRFIVELMNSTRLIASFTVDYRTIDQRENHRSVLIAEIEQKS